MLRLLRGSIGCWLGLAALIYVFVYGGEYVTGVTVARFAMVTALLSLAPTLVFGLFEKPSWGVWPYLIIGGVLSIIGTGLILAPMTLVQPFAGTREEWLALTFVAFCASLVGATAGGAYRLFAGVKPE